MAQILVRVLQSYFSMKSPMMNFSLKNMPITRLLVFTSLVVATLFSGLLVACAPDRAKRPVEISLVSPGKARKFVKACALTLSESDGKLVRPTEVSSDCVQIQGEDPKVSGVQPKYTLNRKNDLVQIKVEVNLTGDESITEAEFDGIRTFFSSPMNSCIDNIKRVFEKRALFLNFEFNDSDNANDLYLVDMRPEYKDDDEKKDDLRVSIKDTITSSEMSFNGTKQCRDACREDDLICISSCGLESSEPFCRNLLRQVGFWLGLQDETKYNVCLPEKERRGADSESSIFVGYRPDLEPDRSEPPVEEPAAETAGNDESAEKATAEASEPEATEEKPTPEGPSLDFWARIKLTSQQVMEILQPVCNEKNVEVQR